LLGFAALTPTDETEIFQDFGEKSGFLHSLGAWERGKNGHGHRFGRGA
jgi:hypothetical protein